MPRTVVQIKVCDMPHDREVEAAATETFMLNGYRYRMDLCEPCSARLAATVGAFADHAIQTGEPGVVDRRRPVRQVVVEQPRPRPAAAPVAAELRREQAMARPELPPTAHRWTVNEHAQERMAERSVDLYEVLMTAERPERDTQAQRKDPDPDIRELLRGDIKLMVNRRTLEVLTVARRSQSVYAQFPPTQKATA